MIGMMRALRAWLVATPETKPQTQSGKSQHGDNSPQLAKKRKQPHERWSNNRRHQTLRGILQQPRRRRTFSRSPRLDAVIHRHWHLSRPATMSAPDASLRHRAVVAAVESGINVADACHQFRFQRSDAASAQLWCNWEAKGYTRDQLVLRNQSWLPIYGPTAKCPAIPINYFFQEYIQPRQFFPPRTSPLLESQLHCSRLFAGSDIPQPWQSLSASIA